MVNNVSDHKHLYLEPAGDLTVVVSVMDSDAISLPFKDNEQAVNDQCFYPLTGPYIPCFILKCYLIKILTILLR